MGDMRWERLFEDLEAQLVAQERLDVEAEIADRTRRERALVSWVDRLSAHVDRASVAPQLLSFALAHGDVVSGRVRDLGKDWVLIETLRDQGRSEALVPLDAIRSIQGLGARASEGGLRRRFGLGSALRTLARDRAVVEVVDRSGQTVAGTIDVVLADALELAVHAVGELRRAENVRGRVLIPVAAVGVVRRLG